MKTLFTLQIVLILALLAFPGHRGFAGEAPAFEPGKIWPDDNGVHINAHGGGILFHEGMYYWFGEHKVEGEIGNTAQVGVHVYSSKDLYNWKDEGIALPVSNDPESDITKGCIIERPKVIYNAKTKKFVMWFHLELKGKGYQAARSGVAVADNVTGPYAFIESFRPNNNMARDQTLFVDDDGKAYQLYASEDNKTLHISLLSDDYLTPAGEYVRVFENRLMEAPAICKRKGKYYLLASGCTGWKPNAARSAVADHIFGPWKELGNPCVGINPDNNLGPDKTFGAQSTFILKVQGKEDAFIAMFDIWRPENAIDGRYVWLPMQFADGGFKIKWMNQWDMSIFDNNPEHHGEQKKHPNLVIVFPDQMRGQALGFLNEDPVITPHLDRFAGESLVLPQAVANYPVCSPFRAMLMTGKYPHANRVIANVNSRSEPFGVELQESDRCWSDVLNDEGYSLGYIGKWHLDSPRTPYVDCSNNRGEPKWNEWCPPERRHGFDYWYSYGTYDMHMNPMYWSTDAKRDEFHFVRQWGPAHEADLAIEYIHNKDGKYRKPNGPFALVVSMNPPHTPYNQFPKKYLEDYADQSPHDLLVRPNVDKSGTTPMSRLALGQTRNYFANVTGVDEQFGRILQAIDDAGLKENTIVLFTSDHGDCVGTHNKDTKNNPFEESMRIPFIIRWPGRIPVRHDDLLISVPDIYPTLLELMGFKDGIPEAVQGSSHAGLFLGKEGVRPSSQLYLRIPYNNPSYGVRGVRTHAYKLVISADLKGPLKTNLYDLKADPYEMNDIAATSAHIVEILIKTELYPWLERTGDPWIEHLKKPTRPPAATDKEG